MIPEDLKAQFMRELIVFGLLLLGGGQVMLRNKIAARDPDITEMKQHAERCDSELATLKDLYGQLLTRLERRMDADGSQRPNLPTGRERRKTYDERQAERESEPAASVPAELPEGYTPEDLTPGKF